MSHRILVDIEGMDRETWLQWRRKGIGGSDAPAVLGLHPWVSPMEVFMDKVGLTPLDAGDDNERMHWGNTMEEVIRQQFQTERYAGLPVTKPDCIYQHPEHEWMLCNLDGIVDHPEDGPGVFEAKNSSEYMRDKWEDDAPIYHRIQLQHNIAVMGYDYGYIAVTLGGNGLKFFRYERDEEMIRHIIETEAAFWSDTMQGIPPEADGSKVTEEFLNDLYSDAEEGLSMILPVGIGDDINERNEIRQQIKDLEYREREIKNKIRDLLGEATEGIVAGESRVTWRPVTRRTFDSKRFQQEHPDLYERFLRESVSRRLMLK